MGVCLTKRAISSSRSALTGPTSRPFVNSTYYHTNSQQKLFLSRHSRHRLRQQKLHMMLETRLSMQHRILHTHKSFRSSRNRTPKRKQRKIQYLGVKFRVRPLRSIPLFRVISRETGLKVGSQESWTMVPSSNSHRGSKGLFTRARCGATSPMPEISFTWVRNLRSLSLV